MKILGEKVNVQQEARPISATLSGAGSQSQLGEGAAVFAGLDEAVQAARFGISSALKGKEKEKDKDGDKDPSSSIVGDKWIEGRGARGGKNPSHMSCGAVDELIRTVNARDTASASGEERPEFYSFSTDRPKADE